MKNQQSTTHRVLHLLSRNEIEIAIDILRQLIQCSFYQNKVILMASRFHRMKRQEAAGLLDAEERQTEENCIRRGLVVIASRVG